MSNSRQYNNTHKQFNRTQIKCRNCGNANAKSYHDYEIKTDDGTSKFYVCRGCYFYINKCAWKNHETRNRCNNTPLDPMNTISPAPYCEEHYTEWQNKRKNKECWSGKSCNNPNCKFVHEASTTSRNNNNNKN